MTSSGFLSTSRLQHLLVLRSKFRQKTKTYGHEVTVEYIIYNLPFANCQLVRNSFAMVLLKSLLLAAVATVATARSAVIDLTPSNFDKVVLNSGKPTLVEFFAPWCGHCKTLAPVYEELALGFEHAKDKVQIAKVDADAERELGKRFGIQGFPTLKWFDGTSDTPEDYKSGRDIDSLRDFITTKTSAKLKKKQELPSSVVMLSDKTFTETIGSDKNVLVAFTAPWCGRTCNALEKYAS